MKKRGIALFIILGMITVPSLKGETGPNDNSTSASLGGVAGFFEGKSKESIRRSFETEARAWAFDAISVIFSDSASKNKGSGLNPAEIFSAPETRLKFEALVKEKLFSWLEGEVTRVVTRVLLGEDFKAPSAEEVMEMARRAAREALREAGVLADRVAGLLYESAAGKIREEVLAGSENLLDITKLRESIDRTFDLSTVCVFAEDGISRLVGDSAVAAVRSRIEDALGGRLPPEVISALQRGPAEFERYVQAIEENLPGRKLRELKGSILNRPVIKIPTAAYAAILAASAAEHYAQAYKGVTVDLYELKRAEEVTRVMVWQLNNRRWINLTVMQLAKIGRNLAGRIGIGEELDRIVGEMRKPVDRVRKLSERMDELIKKPIDSIRRELKELVGEVEEELKKIQRMITDPVKKGIDEVDEVLDRAGSAFAEVIPEGFNGLPGSWDDMKRKLNVGNPSNGAPVASPLGPTAEITDAESSPAENASWSDELDPVLLHNGEFVYRVTDLVIPGRGIDFRFSRTCRARSDFIGEMGWRCTHSYATKLLRRPDGFTYVDEEGLKHDLRRRGDGAGFVSPEGFAAELISNDEGHELVRDDGVSYFFDSAGRMVSQRDRYGNTVKLIYGAGGLLSEIEDVFGRRMRIDRRKDGLVSAIRDFAERKFVYEYNDRNEMIGATSPATPDFPKGKTTAYRYDRSHRIAMIVDPMGRPYLKNRYDDDGRLVAQSYGEAGGPWMRATYGEGSGEVASRAWVTDAAGRTRLYEHDKGGRLLRKWLIISGDYKLLVQYRYDSHGRRDAECLPSGRCRLFVFEGGAGGRRLSRTIEHPAGGKVTRVKDEFTKTGEVRLQRNSLGQIIEEEASGGEMIRYEYYSASDPDGDGVSVSGAAKEIEGGGYLKRMTRGKTFVEFTYDPVGNITSTTDESGQKKKFRVNALNQIVREEGPGEESRLFHYDACDNLVRVAKVGSPGLREFSYDAMGRVLVDKLELSPGRFAETKFIRSRQGTLEGIVRPEGNQLTFEYDFEGRPSCIIGGAGSPEESRECVERDEDGEITAYIDGEGSRTTIVRDGFGDVIEIIDPLGNRSEIERDAAGRFVGARFVDSGGKLLSASRVTYDLSGSLDGHWRLLWRDDPAKSRWVKFRMLASMKDSEGPKDIVARPGRTGRGPALTWNLNGLLSSLTDAAGKKTLFFYDSLDRLVLERYPDGTERRTSYDRRGLVTRSAGRGGELLEMEYDAAGQLTSRRAMPADGSSGSRMQRFERDGLGRITRASDEGDEVGKKDEIVSRFAYDSLSRPVAEEMGGRWLTREFDDEGRVTVLSLPSGNTLFYAYGPNGRMESMMAGGAMLASFEYGSSGFLSAGQLGDGLSAVVGRGDDGRISSLRYLRPGGESAYGFEVLYGEGGLVSDELRGPGILRRFGRDQTGKLLCAADLEGSSLESSSGAECFSPTSSRIRGWRYSYDLSENVSRKDLINPSGKVPDHSYAAGGNLASLGEIRFFYDPFGRLIEVRRGSKILTSYSYDAFDRRVAKEAEGEVNRYFWNGFQLAGEEGEVGREISYAYGPAGNAPIAAISEGMISYLLADRMGSVAAIADASGEITARCDHEPYGMRIEDETANSKVAAEKKKTAGCDGMIFPFDFAGHIRDDETGLIYMRHRYFSPTLARFITPDPLGYKVIKRRAPAEILLPPLAYHTGQGGASRATFPNRPLRVSGLYGVWPFGRLFAGRMGEGKFGESNLYAYADGDPSTFVDPLGLASLLFDRSEEKLFLIMENGYEWGAFAASNRATRPDADPLRVGGNGPFPNGTFSIGLPEFYSLDYREEVLINYEMGYLAPWEALVTGGVWSGGRENKPDYSGPYGRIRIRAGSPEDGPVWERGLFIHGGRHDYRKKTLGCIRVDDYDLELLAIGMVNLMRDNDPVTHITVQD